jgi:2-iminoacetate synthase
MFSEEFDQTLAECSSPRLKLLKRLLQPMTQEALGRQCSQAAQLTRQHFGKTIRLFAPVYLSNECINNCAYCGFSRDNPILRVTLSVSQVIKECRHLAEQGMRQILLVAGEHPKFVSEGYLEQSIRAIRGFIPAIGLEVGPMEAPEYQRMVTAGAEGLVVYQETYHRPTYAEMHTLGPKKDFDWRLDCAQRAYQAGFRRIGIGALLGLSDWRGEVLALGAHLEYLLKHCWKAFFTVALPRMRPAAGEFQPREIVSDAHFIQALTALRVVFPEVGIVMSTREPAALRDAFLPYGVTHMSAGSHTEPGGYTGEGREDLHLTVKGRRVERTCPSEKDAAEAQFQIHDTRSPQEFAQMLAQRGFDTVWKDWDEAILAH